MALLDFLEFEGSFYRDVLNGPYPLFRELCFFISHIRHIYLDVKYTVYGQDKTGLYKNTKPLTSNQYIGCAIHMTFKIPLFS